MIYPQYNFINNLKKIYLMSSHNNNLDVHQEFRYTTNSAQRQPGGTYYNVEKRQTVSPGAIGAASSHSGANYIKTSDGRLIPVQSGVTYQSGYRAGSGDISGTGRYVGSGDISGNQHISTSYQRVPGETYRQTRTVNVAGGQPQRQTHYYETRNSGGAVGGGVSSGYAVGGASSGYASGGGNYNGQVLQKNNIVTEQREVERPQYQKLYSNNSGGRASANYDSNARVSGDAGLAKKKSKCHPALLALLGCLALAGIILGILFGTGVLGKRSGEAGEYTLIDGQQYLANTVTVESTYIQNNAQNGQPAQSSSAIIPGAAGAAGAAGIAAGSYLISKDSSGNDVINKDGQSYPVTTIGDNKVVNIDGKDQILVNGNLYPVQKQNGFSYYEVAGTKYKLPEQNNLVIEKDSQGNRYVNQLGNKYPIETIKGREYVQINGKRYLLFNGKSYEISSNSETEINGFKYRVDGSGRLLANIDGKEYPTYRNNDQQFAFIDGQNYLLYNGNKYLVETDSNSDMFATINGVRYDLGPAKSEQSVVGEDGFKYFVDSKDGQQKVYVDGQAYQYTKNNGLNFINKNNIIYALYEGKTYEVKTAADGSNYIVMNGQNYSIGRLDYNAKTNTNVRTEVQPIVVQPQSA